MKTIQDWLDLVEKNSWNFQDVPKEFIDLEMCKYAVKNSYNFPHVPKEFMTLEFCKYAVKNSYNFPHVPKKFIKSIRGSKDLVEYFYGFLKIGCKIHSLDFWKENYKEIGLKNNYPLEQIEEYGKIINSL